MANNRLYIEDTETGEQFLLAKGFGNYWTPVNDLSDRLYDWLNTVERDIAASLNGATKLRLVTEDTLFAESQAAGKEKPP